MRADGVRERLAGLETEWGAHGMLRQPTAEERAVDDPGRRCAIALADGLAVRIGGEAREWTRGLSEVSRVRARGIMAYVLAWNLAYRGTPSPFLLEAADAALLAGEMVACFSADARFFTNGRAAIGDHDEVVDLAGWVPVTRATFDWGVVMCDERYVGYVWAEAED
jgi:hypothetical protein